MTYSINARWEFSREQSQLYQFISWPFPACQIDASAVELLHWMFPLQVRKEIYEERLQPVCMQSRLKLRGSSWAISRNAQSIWDELAIEKTCSAFSSRSKVDSVPESAGILPAS
jgi:hypothetical protein